jgi:hypothetical protein
LRRTKTALRRPQNLSHRGALGADNDHPIPEP